MYVSSILQRMLARNQKRDRSSIFHYIGVVLPYLTSMAVRQGVTLTSSYKSYTWSSFLTGSGHVREGTVLTIQVNRIISFVERRCITQTSIHLLCKWRWWRKGTNILLVQCSTQKRWHRRWVSAYYLQHHRFHCLILYIY